LNGADLNKTNHNNLDALSLAIIAKQEHVIEYLISKGIQIQRNISKRMNQYDLSKLYGSRLTNEILKNAGGSPQLKTWIDKMFINPLIQFNAQDVMMGFQTGIIDSKNGLQLEAGYKTRPWVRSVLYEVNESTYYQFWEKRSVVHIGLEKNFNLTNPFYYEKLGVFGGLNFAYTYGNFRGSDRKPDDGLKLVPKAGIFYYYKSFNLKLNYEYMKFNNNTSSPHRIGISFGVLINLVKDRIQLKPEPVL
jgi:hypothetical protein